MFQRCAPGRVWFLLLCLPLVTAQSCPSTTPPVADENKTQADKQIDLSGTWRHVNGSVLADVSPGFQPTYLVLSGEGAGKLYQSESVSGAAICIGLGYARTAETIQMDLLLRGSRGEVPRTFEAKLSENDLLTLTEAGGNSSTFARDTAVAAAAQCGTLRVVSRYALRVGPHGNSGLVFDGAALWFRGSGSDLIYPVNPDTGALGEPLTLSPQYTNIHAAQDDTFWTFCWCNGNTDARRRTRTGMDAAVIDTNSLGQLMSLFAMAYDPAGRVLWLSGRSFTDNVSRLVRVNSNALPPAVTGSGPFNVPLVSMTVAGPSLWAITQFQSIVQIDTETLRTTANFETPDAEVTWQGIAAIGPRLFLIGRNAEQQGVLVELAL